MMSPSDMEAWLRDMLSECMPREAAELDPELPDLVQALYAGEDIRKPYLEAAQAAESGVLPPELAVVGSALSALVVAYHWWKTAESMRSDGKKLVNWFKPRDPSSKKLSDQWRAELVAAGVAEPTADKIVAKFSADLTARLGV
jgi:hypothetical protein